MTKILILVMMWFYPTAKPSSYTVQVDSRKDAVIRLEQIKEWHTGEKSEVHLYEVDISCKTIKEIPMLKVKYLEADK